MSTIEERVAALENTIGDPTQPALEGVNNVDLPNRDAKILKSLKQLHVFANGVVGTPGIPGDVGLLGRAVEEIAAMKADRNQLLTVVQALVQQVNALSAVGPIVPPPVNPPTPVTSDALPPAFQWPRAENGFVSPANSGGPSGKPADQRLHREGWVCVSNISPDGTNATSGPNGQAMGIGGASKGKIRVNTRGGAEGDGGMRDITNYVNLEERPGVGTISRRGYDIFCSVPDAISIRTAVWTTNPDGKRDGGDSVMRRIDANHFIGNWSDPALDYEDRPFVISGGDQPDRDRFSTKAGADSNACYGWRVDRPRNAVGNHPTYNPNDPSEGYTDKGDFLVRLFHDNGREDVGRYSRYRLYNEGRGMAWALSDGTYAQCQDVMVAQPGEYGNPGFMDIAIKGFGLRRLETFTLPDGREGICFNPNVKPTVSE